MKRPINHYGIERESLTKIMAADCTSCINRLIPSSYPDLGRISFSIAASEALTNLCHFLSKKEYSSQEKYTTLP